MKSSEYFAYIEERVKSDIALSKQKNHDYTNGNDDDPFANFRTIEAFGTPVNAELGLFVRLTDKMARLATWLSKKELQVKDESVMDTLSDARNYLCLLEGLILDKIGAVDEAKRQMAAEEKAAKMPDTLAHEEMNAKKTPQSPYVWVGEVQGWVHRDVLKDHKRPKHP